MIELRRQMDPSSVDIMRDGTHIGYLQWHRSGQPRIILLHSFGFLTLSEVKTVLSRYKQEERSRLKFVTECLKAMEEKQ